MRDWRWARRYQFSQYTMYAPQRFSPFLRETIVRVLSHTRQQESKASGMFRGWHYSQGTLMAVTGPGMFTDTILETLSSSLLSTHPVQQSVRADAEIGDLILTEIWKTQERVTWAPFHRLSDTLCVGKDEVIPTALIADLCVLPISVWGNGQRHS